MDVAKWTARCLAGAALSLLGGCLAQSRNLAGGSVEYRPALLTPVFPLAPGSKGRVGVGGGAVSAKVGTVMLDNRGSIGQTVDDSSRVVLEGMLGLGESWAVRVALQSYTVGVMGSWHHAWKLADVEAHFGAHVSQMQVVQVDSVYPGALDFLSSPYRDTASEKRRGIAPELGCTVVLRPEGFVRPWLSWSMTTLADPGMESAVQEVVPTGGFVHSFSGGLVAGEPQGLTAWGGGGAVGVADGRMRWGWNAYGGIGWEF